MNMFLLSTLIIIYLTIISYLGYRGYIETKNAADYMVGGRNIHPYIMAMSYGATFISTSAIVGFGGAAALFGMSLLWLTVFNIGVGIFVAFIFYGKKNTKNGIKILMHILFLNFWEKDWTADLFRDLQELLFLYLCRSMQQLYL